MSSYDDIMDFLADVNEWPPCPDPETDHFEINPEILPAVERRRHATVPIISGSVLALDIATLTGWAIRRPDGIIVSGTASFKPTRFEGAGMRYLRFAQWLDGIDPPSVIYFEEVRRHCGADAAHAYGGLLGILTAWCEARRIPYAGIPVGTIKSFTTGRGNAPKSAMIAAIQGKGFRPADDNEADAIATLLYVLATRRLTPPSNDDSALLANAA